MNRNSRRKLLLLAAALLGIAAGVLGYRATVRSERQAMDRLAAAAQQAGLKNVRITTGGWGRDSIWYTVQSSNFSEFSISRMQEADACISSADCNIRKFWVFNCQGYVSSFVCGGDHYEIFSDMIFRNGDILYDKEAEKEKRKAAKEAKEQAGLMANLDKANRRATYGETRGAGSSDGDEYDARDYTDVDQFYDDHYDDFESFDEAEQYWQEFSR